VLARPVSLKLLAPGVLIGLLLVVTCISGALVLNQKQIGVARVLTENVASTLAAADLEATVTEMIRQLTGDHSNSEELTRQLGQRLRVAEEQFLATQALANMDVEKVQVAAIEGGLRYYREGWEDRVNQSADTRTVFDRQLAHRLEERVLPACRALRHFNDSQVDASDRANRSIVNGLTWGLLGVGIGAPLSGLLLGYAVARRLYQSIHQMSVSIRDAAGRLNRELRPVTVEGPDGLPDLHQQMQGVIEEIERVVGELQQREREVLRAEQLAAVGQVAAGVAHELRNPLTSVKMLVQTGLEGTAPSGLPPDDLRIIEHEVRRMEACIQTFLDFARPPVSERRRTDLLAVARRSLTLIEGRARRQQVTTISLVPPTSVEVLIDAEQIHQVLLNLLLNALDALPHGGEIRVQVTPASPETPQVTVCVRDNGPGIVPRIRERLFEPFVSGKETGLGLGLSICKRLVEAHGGTIHGENASEGGAVFTFTLPV
jgi:signal transduction histidine kinase